MYAGVCGWAQTFFCVSSVCVKTNRHGDDMNRKCGPNMKAFFALAGMCALSSCAAGTPPAAAASAQVHAVPQETIAQAVGAAKQQDLSCLTDVQKAEYQRRMREHVVLATEEISQELITRAMIARASPSGARAAAQKELTRCEEALPAGTDKVSACTAERSALETAAGMRAPGIDLALKHAVRRMHSANALRAEFPPCGDSAPQ